MRVLRFFLAMEHSLAFAVIYALCLIAVTSKEWWIAGGLGLIGIPCVTYAEIWFARKSR